MEYSKKTSSYCKLVFDTTSKLLYKTLFQNLQGANENKTKMKLLKLFSMTL